MIGLPLFHEALRVLMHASEKKTNVAQAILTILIGYCENHIWLALGQATTARNARDDDEHHDNTAVKNCIETNERRMKMMAAEQDVMVAQILSALFEIVRSCLGYLEKGHLPDKVHTRLLHLVYHRYRLHELAPWPPRVTAILLACRCMSTLLHTSDPAWICMPVSSSSSSSFSSGSPLDAAPEPPPPVPPVRPNQISAMASSMPTAATFAHARMISLGDDTTSQTPIMFPSLLVAHIAAFWPCIHVSMIIEIPLANFQNNTSSSLSLSSSISDRNSHRSTSIAADTCSRIWPCLKQYAAIFHAVASGKEYTLHAQNMAPSVLWCLEHWLAWGVVTKETAMYLHLDVKMTAVHASEEARKETEQIWMHICFDVWTRWLDLERVQHPASAPPHELNHHHAPSRSSALAFPKLLLQYTAMTISRSIQSGGRTLLGYVNEDACKPCPCPNVFSSSSSALPSSLNILRRPSWLSSLWFLLVSMTLTGDILLRCIKVHRSLWLQNTAVAYLVYTRASESMDGILLCHAALQTRYIVFLFLV
jgi:hypothetical protein